MAKNWVKIETVNDVKKNMDSNKVEKNMNLLIKKTPSLSVQDMKKAGNELFDKAQKEDEQLLAAFEAKKLKSKRLIKKAEHLLSQKKTKVDKKDSGAES